jgi:adenine-specific DNA-methyltransferase
VLNSGIIDQLFRCINGSVAVSAFEMEALPLPSPAAMRKVQALVARGAPSVTIEQELARLYGQAAS